MAVTTTTTTPPSTIVISPGECVILPSNVIILSAFTFDDAPDVQSDDCPELVTEITDKLEFALDYCVKMAESSRQGNPDPNYDNVWIKGIRVNDVEYPFTTIPVPTDPGIDILVYSTPLNSPTMVTIWQKAIDSTAIGGSIKITSVERAPTDSQDNNSGYQIRIKLKTFPSIQKDFTFYGLGRSSVGPQAPGVDIEFRVVECD